MALLFNATFRRNLNGQEENEGKWYATLRRISFLKEKDVAKRMAEETTLNPKECEFAIAQLLKVLKTELLNGNSVQLGDWGSFYLTASSDGVENKADVSAGLIKKLNVRFRPGTELKDTLKNATFKPTSSLQ